MKEIHLVVCFGVYKDEENRFGSLFLGYKDEGNQFDSLFCDIKMKICLVVCFVI